MNTELSPIEQIRTASRTIVRELGFMQTTLAGTNYSSSAVHALLEIGIRGATTAAQLVQVLGLEKSSVSRMLGKLIEVGELKETVGSDDGRSKQLSLTAKGEHTVQRIHSYAQVQVQAALERLNPSQQQVVVQGLAVYAKALKMCRQEATETTSASIQVSAGYRPGLVGRITEMHAAFYFSHSGFGQFFESKVASGVAEFVGRLNQPCNGIWVATLNDRIIGSIAIDGEDLGNNTAHLRWFILDDGCRGSGVGRQLLSEAVNFCDRQGFEAVQLWTFKGLDAARRLYESSGFVWVREEQGDQWGNTVTEQQFIRYKRSVPL